MKNYNDVVEKKGKKTQLYKKKEGCEESESHVFLKKGKGKKLPL